MKINSLLLFMALFSVFSASSQNLHNSSNAASVENEANTTSGWAGPAALSSDMSTAQNGMYSLRVAVQNTSRDARYTFNAVVGSVYNISIWARRSANSNNPAFANWLGLQGFSTTVIGSTTWTQYNFTVTATITNPSIRVYAGPIGAATDADVFIDAVSIFLQTPADTQAPTSPSNLSSSDLTTQSFTLNWTASTDNVGVTNYSVLQNNVTIGIVGGTTTSFPVTGLSPSTSYTYVVTAVDAANNVSPASDSLTITTLAPAPDTIAPTAPVNLSASNVTNNSIGLTWIASTDNIAVTGYTIFINGVLDTTTANTQYLATGLSPATEYTFYVSAYDAAGNNSAPGNIIEVTTTDPSQVTTYTSTNSNLPSVSWQSADFYASGNVGIGTMPSNTYRMSVNGSIRSKEIIVETGWSDFVFEDDYNLASLEEVEAYIIKHRHLKDIPSAVEVEKNGISLGNMNKLLLMKIEELTLYIIEANKNIKSLEQEVSLIKDNHETSMIKANPLTVTKEQ
jgi:chitodextrinase